MSPSEKIFTVLNYIVLTFLVIICVIPFIHLIALSFSSSAAATSGTVGLIPKDFTIAAYKLAIEGKSFITAFMVSVKRVFLAVIINLIIMILTAYPLSKSDKVLPGRKFFSGYLIATMLISGGMIPLFMVVRSLKLANTIWALILPGAMSVWNTFMMMNFFRRLPKELEESAVIDGASQIQVLSRIVMPLSLPIIATMTLFVAVGHWNEWFSALIYMDSIKDYPLQTYLQMIITTPDYSQLDTLQLEEAAKVSNKNFQAAQILIATVPILVVYPFCQKYFVTGLTIGSVKG